LNGKSLFSGPFANDTTNIESNFLVLTGADMNYRKTIPCLKNTGSLMMLGGSRIKSRKSSASG
jgi:hypothetical protein